MPSRDHRLQIDDILAAIARIRAYTQGMTYDDFAAGTKTQDAVVRNLEIIGEAARTLPDEVKQRTSAVDWHKMVALRNILIREYFGISLPIVWDVIANKLGVLEGACIEIVNETG